MLGVLPGDLADDGMGKGMKPHGRGHLGHHLVPPKHHDVARAWFHPGLAQRAGEVEEEVQVALGQGQHHHGALLLLLLLLLLFFFLQPPPPG